MPAMWRKGNYERCAINNHDSANLFARSSQQAFVREKSDYIDIR